MTYSIKKHEDNSFYDIVITKEVHKRTGEIAEEPLKIYGVPLNHVLNRAAAYEISNIDKDFSLAEFMKKFNEVCESLKKTL